MGERETPAEVEHEPEPRAPRPKEEINPAETGGGDEPMPPGESALDSERQDATE